MLLLQFISRVILLILGWKGIRRMSSKGSLKRTVMIFPHTTKLDYLFFLLNTFADPSEVEDANFKVLMSERYSWIFFLSSNIIPVPDSYVRYYMSLGYTYNQSVFETFRVSFLSFFSSKYKLNTENTQTYNFVENTAKLIENESFSILISPTGSITDKEWKSGYYHLSRRLNCSVTVCGIDYYDKTAVIFQPVFYQNKEELEMVLKSQFNTISTYKPNTENDFVDYPTFTSLIGSFLLIPKMIEISRFYGYWAIIMSCISYYYHYSKETCLCLTDKVSCLITFFLIYLHLYIQETQINIFSNILFCIAFFNLGKSWGCTKPRKNVYYFSHSLFHIFSTLAIHSLI